MMIRSQCQVYMLITFYFQDTPLSIDDVEELCNYLEENTQFSRLSLQNTQVPNWGLIDRSYR